MGVTVQVRDLDAAVQQRLLSAARQEGLSLSAFLRRELTALAEDIEMRGKLDGPLGPPHPSLLNVDIEEIVGMIREDRERG